ncbi:hypothetical protein [Leptospira interrogans]|uniref:hypothetical protein n=1 Tax=Leptospira interrogans TaxID=173 RepID=UPI0002F4B6F6|nr:hypothetical protein [Leptospira interrogans]MBM2888893.1 hypothetical protein [Leptospira interrogans]
MSNSLPEVYKEEKFMKPPYGSDLNKRYADGWEFIGLVKDEKDKRYIAYFRKK